ncbi:fumarylacetoacetate hydrolase family protein [Cryptosporangium arvum]|uniref:Fumarylacetoacetate (FAA) hydrolase family protein n=1 Tax=Cryptosporangium arvum DSM 44712 TaxID=927661 RepID=A0A011AGX6_9ACTN|nr:fumarylacetoacetate hydrolase family protein [Cryptosporangium arvum]EXG81241.1 fumarylacetoacetate (FAA) hydrolase family protein [Cryptosporangium arvum DSM 44712]
MNWPPTAALPADADAATLVGRVWRPGLGPSVVAVRGGELVDVTGAFPTVRELTESPDPATALADAPGEPLGPLAEILANTPPETRDATRPHLLAPVDLHVVKAAGVTFAASMLERVIEERVRGDAGAAADARADIHALIGTTTPRPGSPEAAKLREVLVAEGRWSQYLEVGLGPDAEIFTKAPVLAAVGTAVDAGVRRDSTWNNPEPEVVIVVSSAGAVVGATLGNDVNLRDVEGRSALLLPQAKDNNASAALGPFLRLFDAGFGLDDVRVATVTLTVDGEDGYHLDGESSMAEISRDPAELAAQLMRSHCYPDGAVLYLGTMFAPTADRHTPGLGFTHDEGDVVTVASPRLGTLTNRIRPADACEPWTFGLADLMRSLRERYVREAPEERS